MDTYQAKEHIEKNLNSGDSLIGFFYCQQPLNTWLKLLIGPLAILGMKNYFIAVSTKGINFYRLNFLGKFSNNDFFEFSEIEKVIFGKGIVQRPINFHFKNGRKIKILALLRGATNSAKLNETTQQHIENNIKIV